MVNSAPHNREIEQSTGLTGEKLVDGEVTGNEVGTNVFPILFRTYTYPRFAWRITEASSPESMVAWRRRASASPSSPMMVSLGEHCYGT